MSDIVIHGPPQSTYVWTSRLVCAEKGVEHRLDDVEFGSDAHFALHPFAKVPILTVGDFRLYETSAIARFIDETNQGTELQPSDAAQRALMEQVISAYEDYFYEYLVRRLAINRLVVPARGGETDEALIVNSMTEIERCLSVTEDLASKNDYLAGSEVTLADLFVLPAIYYVDKTPEGADLLPKFPALKAWNARMEERPSFHQTQPPMPQANAAE